MQMDWNRYRICCAQLREPVLTRFETTLLEGAGMSTVQSAPAYAGALTAALITVLRQMRDLLRQEAACGEGKDPACTDWNRLGRKMRELYFLRLAGVDRLKVAQEYVREHYQYQDRSADGMAPWMLSFQGQHREAGELVRRIDEVTDAFIREDLPGIWKSAAASAGGKR